MESNEKINDLQQKLHDTDQKIIESLKQFFNEEQINLIMQQLNSIYSLITKTEMRYQYSKDYRDAIDIVMGLIIGGKFINNSQSIMDNPFNKKNNNKEEHKDVT